VGWDGVGNPPIGSRPVNPGPGPGRWRDYFITVGGKEPTDCHMVIRWKAPVNIGMVLPQGADVMCVGDCDRTVYAGCAPDVIMDPVRGIRMIRACACALPPLKVRREFRSVIEASESVQRSEAERQERE